MCFYVKEREREKEKQNLAHCRTVHDFINKFLPNKQSFLLMSSYSGSRAINFITDGLTECCVDGVEITRRAILLHSLTCVLFSTKKIK